MAQLVAAGAGGVTLVASSVCNGIISCMNAAAENKLRINQRRYEHELNMQSAQFAREREQNQSEAKE